MTDGILHTHSRKDEDFQTENDQAITTHACHKIITSLGVKKAI